MITILVELNSRKFGRSMKLLPFDDGWPGSNTCCDMLHNVLVTPLKKQPSALATLEIVKMCCTKQEVVT
jgi:hypothetical protein